MSHITEMEQGLRRLGIDEALIERAKEVVRKYKGDTPLMVAGAIVYVAEENPERLELAIEVIGKYKGVVAMGVADAIVSVVMENPERLGVVCNAFNKYSEVIGKYKEEVADVIERVAKENPERLELAIEVIGKYKGVVAIMVAAAIESVVVKNPEELKVLLYILSKIGSTDDYIKCQQGILKLPMPFFTFKKKYMLTGTGSAIEANEDANKRLYEVGMEIINGVTRGKIRLKPSLEFFYPEEMKRFGKEAQELRQRINMAGGNDAESRRRMIETKKSRDNLENNLRERKRKELQKISWTLGKLKEELSQLSQHWLDKNIAKQAKVVSEEILVAEGELSSTKVEVWVWQKTIEKHRWPTYGEYKCCAFAGYRGNEDSLFDYIITPAVQLLKLQIGEKTAIAIGVATITKKRKKVLLINSFESGSNLFSRKEVAATALQALKDWAKESGFDLLLVVPASNSAPKAFYENIEGKKVSGSELEIMGPMIHQPYLETNLEKAMGKVFGV